MNVLLAGAQARAVRRSRRSSACVRPSTARRTASSASCLLAHANASRAASAPFVPVPTTRPVSATRHAARPVSASGRTGARWIRTWHVRTEDQHTAARRLVRQLHRREAIRCVVRAAAKTCNLSQIQEGRLVSPAALGECHPRELRRAEEMSSKRLRSGRGGRSDHPRAWAVGAWLAATTLTTRGM